MANDNLSIQNAIWSKISENKNIPFDEIIKRNYLETGFNMSQTKDFMQYPTVVGQRNGLADNEWGGDRIYKKLRMTPHPIQLDPFKSSEMIDILPLASGINNLASTAGSVLAFAMDDPMDRLAKARQDEANKMSPNNPLSGQYAQRAVSYLNEHPELNGLYLYLSTKQREDLYKNIVYQHPNNVHTYPLPPHKDPTPHDITSHAFHTKRLNPFEVGTNSDRFQYSGSSKDSTATGMNYEKNMDAERTEMNSKQLVRTQQIYDEDMNRVSGNSYIEIDNGDLKVTKLDTKKEYEKEAILDARNYPKVSLSGNRRPPGESDPIRDLEEKFNQTIVEKPRRNRMKKLIDYVSDKITDAEFSNAYEMAKAAGIEALKRFFVNLLGNQMTGRARTFFGQQLLGYAVHRVNRAQNVDDLVRMFGNLNI